ELGALREDREVGSRSVVGRPLRKWGTRLVVVVGSGRRHLPLSLQFGRFGCHHSFYTEAGTHPGIGTLPDTQGATGLMKRDWTVSALDQTHPQEVNILAVHWRGRPPCFGDRAIAIQAGPDQHRVVGPVREGVRGV